ncbi:MAG: hypothetical protein A3G41_04680 [Elusimicrobia bacterium RIFCSPLOWO2_12_FULL_59_9]|nr:MAG: hypothetical protein A3G41_04680 [Elusimicrobia bacterium RIFCSPLOWO2_12_FULL_59_9]
MRKLFYISNFGILGVFLLAIGLDHKREWKKHQRGYYEMEAARLEEELKSAGDEAERKSIQSQIRSFRRRPLEIKQIITPDLGRVDRCVTCHVGMDEFTNPSLSNPFAEHPFKAHPKSIAKSHSFQQYGCVACHAGQGLATTAEAAHGQVEHWEEPLLKAPYLEAACAKCHGNFESLSETKTAALGKKLFEKHGCIGCHAVNGRGGVISVDLGDIADKPLARIDFSKSGLDRKDWNIKNWIETHLTKDPMELVPNDPEGHLGEPISPSGMPPFAGEINAAQAQAITTYLLTMSKQPLPHTYYVPGAPAKERSSGDPAKRGQMVFEKYGCAGCHGLGGAAGRRNFNALADKQTRMEDGRVPSLVRVVGTYSPEELKKKIQEGVPSSAISKFKPEGPTPPLYMPGWSEKIKGPELDDLASYLFSVADQDSGGW